MIINLDDNLYVVDNRTHSHKVKTIDVINKIITCVDNTTFKYGTHDLTITNKEVNMSDKEMNVAITMPQSL